MGDEEEARRALRNLVATAFSFLALIFALGLVILVVVLFHLRVSFG